MREPDDRFYLEHIRECIELIELYTRDVTDLDTFLADRKTQDAVLRNLQIMAESTQRLSADTKSKRGEIAWGSISGLRNALVHAYLGINLTTVWRIIRDDLATLKKAVIELLGE
ncbi:MAG TPA: DUF86 domain-containing protein [Anaerolineae bacterium]|jgi:uncharacterized protein with HEPN domain